MTKAAIPLLRAQGSGHIIQVSSIGGIIAFPTVGIYNASKWALEGFTHALAGEVAPFGINVTLVEPIGYTTDWSGPSAARAAPLVHYDDVRTMVAGWFSAFAPGEPNATAEAILAVVDADKPPLRVFFGKGALDVARREYAERISNWEEWNAVAELAMGNER